MGHNCPGSHEGVQALGFGLVFSVRWALGSEDLPHESQAEAHRARPSTTRSVGQGYTPFSVRAVHMLSEGHLACHAACGACGVEEGRHASLAWRPEPPTCCCVCVCVCV